MTPATGSTTEGVITCIPGKYLVEATIYAGPSNYGDFNARTIWKMKLLNGSADLYPASDSNKQTFRCYSDEGNAYKQEGGSASFKAMVDVLENGSQPGRLKIRVQRDDGSGSQSINVRGSIHVTRIANLDGTEGPISSGAAE